MQLKKIDFDRAAALARAFPDEDADQTRNRLARIPRYWRISPQQLKVLVGIAESVRVLRRCGVNVRALTQEELAIDLSQQSGMLTLVQEARRRGLSPKIVVKLIQKYKMDLTDVRAAMEDFPILETRLQN